MEQIKYLSPIGTLLLSCEQDRLCGLDFVQEGEPEDTEITSVSFGETDQKRKQLAPVFQETCRWLDLYFSGKRPDFMPDILLHGTDFQKIVWQELSRIPYGESVSYGDIAKEIVRSGYSARMSAQAVGGAVGRNPVGILIPCHRVLGADKSLTGFGGGLDKKIALLKLEKIHYLEEG